MSQTAETIYGLRFVERIIHVDESTGRVERILQQYVLRPTSTDGTVHQLTWEDVPISKEDTQP